jgi:hypothetical protein
MAAGIATTLANSSSSIDPRTTKRHNSVAGPFTAPMRKRKHSYFSMSFNKLLGSSKGTPEQMTNHHSNRMHSVLGMFMGGITKLLSNLNYSKK